MAPLVPPFRWCTSSPITTMPSSVAMRRAMTPDDGVDELHLRQLSGEVVAICHESVVELWKVAANSDVHEGGVRPFGRLDPALTGLGPGDRLEQHRADIAHQGLGPLNARIQTPARKGSNAATAATTAAERVALPPCLLLLLCAIPERAAGEGSVLVEVPVHLGFDERGPSPPRICSRASFMVRYVARTFIPSTW